MALQPEPQGNFPNPPIIDNFAKEFDVLYDQFWTTVLLYHLDIQVYHYSKVSKGVVDITFVCYNVQAKQIILESKGVIDERYCKALM